MNYRITGSWRHAYMCPPPAQMMSVPSKRSSRGLARRILLNSMEEILTVCNNWRNSQILAHFWWFDPNHGEVVGWSIIYLIYITQNTVSVEVEPVSILTIQMVSPVWYWIKNIFVLIIIYLISYVWIKNSILRNTSATTHEQRRIRHETGRFFKKILF